MNNEASENDGMDPDYYWVNATVLGYGPAVSAVNTYLSTSMAQQTLMLNGVLQQERAATLALAALAEDLALSRSGGLVTNGKSKSAKVNPDAMDVTNIVGNTNPPPLQVT